MEASRAFVSLHNKRNKEKFLAICVADTLLSYGDKYDGSINRKFEEYMKEHPSCYWHMEESKVLLSTTDHTTCSFPVIQFWRTIDTVKNHKIDHFQPVQHELILNTSDQVISSSFTIDLSIPLPISLKRKIKKKAIKFHGKREREAQQQEEIKKESERYHREGELLSKEEREAIRIEKRRKWQEKHGKCDIKKERKERVKSLVTSLDDQELLWRQDKILPQTWVMPRICIDMSFLPSMDTFASGSIRNQLNAIYKRNLNSSNPSRVYICSNDKSKSHLDALLSKLSGVERWPGFSVHPITEAHELFVDPEPLPIIYLSPDAEETLESVDDKHIYVIGGLCDRNREQNVTHSKCKQLNLQSRKLPIDTYISLNGSKILTINAVFSILLSWMENGGDWGNALHANLPKRSVVKIKHVSQ